MSQEHIDSFIAHLKSINRGFGEEKSSLRGLIKFLRANPNSTQALTFQEATNKLSNPFDRRVLKYTPAITALVAVWGTPRPYSNQAVRIAPATLMGGPPGDLVAIPRFENARRFAAAYKRARFFHGDRFHDPEGRMANGLKISESCSKIGASDPGQFKIPGGGPIFLGERYGISLDYGGVEANVHRIFLDATRVVSIPFPTNRVFRAGDPKVYRDHDNPRAVYTMADVPGNLLFSGTLSEVLLANPNAARTIAVLTAIASHDREFASAGIPALLELLRLAISERLLADNASDDKS